MAKRECFMMAYDREEKVYRDGFSGPDFCECDGEAQLVAFAFDMECIIYEQTGRNPPEIVAVWSRS